MKRSRNFIVGVLLVAVMFGLGLFFNARKPVVAQFSSTVEAKLGVRDIRNEIVRARTLFSDRGLLKSETCAASLNGMYDHINDLKIEQFSVANLKSEAPALIQELFDLRVFIRENLQAVYFENKKNVAKDCAFAHRRLFRALRVFEDYLGMLHENVFRAPAKDDSSKPEDFYRVFTGKEPNFLWNAKYKPAEPLKYVPRSGDILLSRGTASVSASIARITDEDSNFSHAGLVYVDPASGQVETVEAHIEFGTLVADIKDYSDMKARSVVFRFKDPEITDEENAALAHQAVSKVRQIVLDYKKKYGKTKYPNPCYDFTMDIDNPQVMVPSNDPKLRKCLFCSEVISLGYSMIESGKYKIPSFKSAINPKNKKFLKDIGVTVESTFAPADVEIEPYFEMVMEWRDYKRIHKTHVMDAILTSMYSWMDDFDYQFYVPKHVQLASGAAYGVRRIPLLDRLTGLDEKFPINMGTAALNTMVMLDEVSNQLANVIYDKESALKVELTPRQMLQTLNDWRVKDLGDFKTNPDYNSKKDALKKHRVHQILRSK